MGSRKTRNSAGSCRGCGPSGQPKAKHLPEQPSARLKQTTSKTCTTTPLKNSYHIINFLVGSTNLGNLLALITVGQFLE